jgi:uncharacterized protein with NRDE domain
MHAMCLIAFAIRPDPEHRLVLVANRDEAYARATLPAAEWVDPPGIIGGRDLRGGGTWLGVTRDGRFAAVTNHHDGSPPRPHAPSRGDLVTAFLTGSREPAEYLGALRERAQDYNGFNLLVGDESHAAWYSNRADAGPRILEPGIYGLSNDLLDTPWPKVVTSRSRLERVLAAPHPPDPSELLEILNDRSIPVDATPGASEFERALTAAFIRTPAYGTRSTTALILRADGGGVLAERTYPPGSDDSTEVRIPLPGG